MTADSNSSPSLLSEAGKEGAGLKVARIATVPFFLDSQLSKQIEELIKLGYRVSAITSPDGEWGRLRGIAGLQCTPILIHRDPSLLGDLLALLRLFQLFRRERFDVVHSTTPKAGLLCAIAARLVGTPLRIHTFTGQTWATKKGVKRWLLAMLDRLIINLGTQAYADSFSQRDFLIQEGVARSRDVKVLGNGSLAGVDLERFCPSQFGPNRVRIELGLDPEDFVLIFVGRLTREKGVLELLEAFQLLMKAGGTNPHLLMVGPTEDAEVEGKILEIVDQGNAHLIGPTLTPEKYLAASDVLCLPSHREGFGTVVIEAAAMQVPAVGTNIHGLRDAIVHRETGLLVEKSNVASLFEALESLFNDRSLCRELGQNAYRRCIKEFDSRRMASLVAEEYAALWSEQCLKKIRE